MSVYIVAEIGQNHQGSVAIAKELIAMAADPRPSHLMDVPEYGCDAVKFTLRDLDHEGTRAMMGAPYEGPNSFGATYREHREALEFTWEEIAELEQHARNHALDFVLTLCHPNCLGVLDTASPDHLKIASRDLTNTPLVEAVSRECKETGIGLMISTGMADLTDLYHAHIYAKKVPDLTIMHCLSQYPAEFGELNLRTIAWLRQQFSERIGYSDHSQGIAAPVAAVALGATVIEKHITLSRTMKGSDHAGSLERDGLWRMCRDITHIDAALGEHGFRRSPACEDARRKLERSVCTARAMLGGEVIEEEHLEPLSPGTGLPWHLRDNIVGSRAWRALPAQTLLTEDDYE